MYVTASNFALSNIKRACHSHFGKVNRPQSPQYRRIRKKTPYPSVFLIKMADRQGFEPWIPFGGIHDFQSCAFDHSAIYPKQRLTYIIFFIFATNFL